MPGTVNKALLLEFVGAHPPAAHDIEIVTDAGRPKRVDEKKMREQAWQQSRRPVSA